MSKPLVVADVMAALDSAYPPELAEAWDSRGLITGSWSAPATRALVSVDICDAVLDEALANGCDIIVTHHPLWLSRHTVVAAPYKLRTQLRAIAHGVAIANAHTNADRANPGVSDALAHALGLTDLRPLLPTGPGERTGTGRIGRLPEPTTAGGFLAQVAARLPTARARLAGNPQRVVSQVAVCGGSGDSLLDLVRTAGVDVYVTSDLRHHPAAEHLEAGGCPLIDINHVAAEATWLPGLGQVLAALGLEVLESRTDTSNWV